jgi:tRNA G18 (ribose-2'-O)-methylase SpoU
METYVVLHNIRSAHNVGSIFRTADGAGVKKIFLCGYTPNPIDRFGRVVEEIRKTSLGATDSVPWEHCDDTDACMEKLRTMGVTVVAVEQHARAIPYTEYTREERVAFVFGNEIDGVPDAVCDQADNIIYIPMRGMKESLNVSVSAGIVLFDRVRER